MRIVEIALPLRDNGGKDLSGAHAAFQTIVCSIFGGYTKRPAGEGAWYSETDGRVHYDRMVPYQIAAEGEAIGSLEARLVEIASPLFPDQQAFFVAAVGRAVIVPPSIRRQPDKATREGAGKTDGAFEAKADNLSSASIRDANATQEPPVKSSTRAPILKPFTYWVAKTVLRKAEEDRVKLSSLTWALSEAVRNYESGEGPYLPVLQALEALAQFKG